MGNADAMQMNIAVKMHRSDQKLRGSVMKPPQAGMVKLPQVSAGSSIPHKLWLKI